MPRRARATPRELAPAWPDGPSSSIEGEVARRFAENLRKVIATRPVRAVAREAGVNHSTLLGILDGQKWPDLETIAKIEEGTNADLWPGRVGGGGNTAARGERG